MNWSIVSLAVVFPITQASMIAYHGFPLSCGLNTLYSADACSTILHAIPTPPHAGHRHGLPAAGAGAARPLGGARQHLLLKRPYQKSFTTHVHVRMCMMCMHIVMFYMCLCMCTMTRFSAARDPCGRRCRLGRSRTRRASGCAHSRR